MTESDENAALWEPVSSGDYNDYPLAFSNVDMEEETLTLNVDGEEFEPEESDGPMFVGTYKGLQDISSEDNPQPSMKHLIESEDDERTYAINNVSSLSNDDFNGGLDQVEEGDTVGVDFEGVVRPDDDNALPWQNFEVYTPKK